MKKKKKGRKPAKIGFGEFRLSSTSRRFVNKVLDSNWISLGPVTKKLESKWANLFGYKYARAVNSGTSALIASFLTLYEFGAKEGDEIICPALSFIATANAIRAAGFKPVFVDVEIETLNINPELIKEKISPRTKAICAVNLMGRPCNLEYIANLAADNGSIPIICDNAEGYGCKFKGKYSLDYVSMEISSNFAAHIICWGEGGVVSTNYESLAHLVESIRSHGRPINSSYFDHQRFGLNLKPTDLHSAIGLGEIGRFWRSFNKRKEHIKELTEYCEKYREFAHFNLPDDEVYKNAPHAFCITIKPKYEYAITTGERSIETMKKILDKSNIEWKRTFGSMPTQHKCFEYLGHKLGEFPVAEYIGNNSLHVSCSQYLKPNDLGRIKAALDSFFFPLLTEKAVDEVFGSYGL